MQPGGFAEPLARQLALAFDEDLAGLSDACLVECELIAVESRLQALEAFVHDLFCHLPVHRGGGRAGARRVFEAEGLRIFDLVDQREGFFEFRVGFPGEAHDEIARQRNIGARGAHIFQQPQVAVCRVTAVHRLEHAVRSALHRQVQIGHQLFDLGMTPNQPFFKIVGMAGRVANTLQFRYLGKLSYQPVQPATVTFRIHTAPRVDVLPKQRDFTRAALRQTVRFLYQIGEGAGNLRAPRIWHDAIGAEFVAALLHREEGCRKAFCPLRQGRELGNGRHVRIGGPFALNRLVQHVGQAVIGLRADDHADRRAASHDLLAFGLRDAACYRDQRFLADLAPRLGQAPDVRIDFLCRLFAYVAGVEDHEIGFLALRRRHDPALVQHVGHALAVIDVHLAAEALDPVGLGGGSRFHSRCAPIAKKRGSFNEKGGTWPPFPSNC